MRRHFFSVLAATATVVSIGTAQTAVAGEEGVQAWSSVGDATLAGLRGGDADTVDETNTLTLDNGSSAEADMDSGNVGAQSAVNYFDAGGNVNTGNVSGTLGGKMTLNAVNTGNNNNMLNQLTVEVHLPDAN
jgi:hypothetical protein